MIEYYKNFSLENLFYIDKNGLVQEETWEIIPNTQNRYEVSNLSRVKSNSYMRYNGCSYRKTEKTILKQTALKIGYYAVVFSFNSKTETKYTHRLVALVFIPNPENKPQVNHINGIKHDNRVENLEWVTAKENSIHAVKNNLIKKSKGESHLKSKLTEAEVLEIRKECKENTLVFIAKKYNVHPATISDIKQKRSWKHLI